MNVDSRQTTSRSHWSFFTTLCLVSFGLNWIWEMAQMRAYTEMAKPPWRDTILPCTLATIGDTVITFAVYGVGALASGKITWGMTGKWNTYATVALLGAACAVAIEWKAMLSGRWSYSERMPIVPVLGVGLWPLLQLTLLIPATQWITSRWAKRNEH